MGQDSFARMCSIWEYTFCSLVHSIAVASLCSKQQLAFRLMSRHLQGRRPH